MVAAADDAREAATAPVSMKVATAAMERGEKRESPPIPCPLVQPDPRPVPNPTAAPARRAR